MHTGLLSLGTAAEISSSNKSSKDTACVGSFMLTIQFVVNAATRACSVVPQVVPVFVEIAEICSSMASYLAK